MNALDGLDGLLGDLFERRSNFRVIGDTLPVSAGVRIHLEPRGLVFRLWEYGREPAIQNLAGAAGPEAHG